MVYSNILTPGAQMVKHYVEWAQTTIETQPDCLWVKLYILKERTDVSQMKLIKNIYIFLNTWLKCKNTCL